MSYIKAPKSTPKISYIPLGAVSYQKLEPFWHGSIGQTGPGFPNGFIGGVKDADDEEVLLKGAVMRGPSGISGPTGHMTCNWWPYINKEGSLNNKVLRGEYYIPLGVLGRDASGVPYPDEKFMKGRGYTGVGPSANNRDYIYKKGITFGISGNIILDTAVDGSGGKISCKSCDIENCKNSNGDAVVFSDNSGILLNASFERNSTTIFVTNTYLRSLHDNSGGYVGEQGFQGNIGSQGPPGIVGNTGMTPETRWYWKRWLFRDNQSDILYTTDDKAYFKILKPWENLSINDDCEILLHETDFDNTSPIGWLAYMSTTGTNDSKGILRLYKKLDTNTELALNIINVKEEGAYYKLTGKILYINSTDPTGLQADDETLFTFFPSGIIAPDGPTGQTGPLGSQGIIGSQGRPGNQGLRGQQGDRGIMGNQGQQGNQGAQGYVDNNGNVGDVGPTGPDGTGGTSNNILDLSTLDAYINDCSKVRIDVTGEILKTKVNYCGYSAIYKNIGNTKLSAGQPVRLQINDNGSIGTQALEFGTPVNDILGIVVEDSNPGENAIIMQNGYTTAKYTSKCPGSGDIIQNNATFPFNSYLSGNMYSAISKFNFTDAKGSGIGSSYNLVGGNRYTFSINSLNIVENGGVEVSQRFSDTRSPQNVRGTLLTTLNGSTTSFVIFAEHGNNFSPSYVGSIDSGRGDLIVGSTTISKNDIRNVTSQSKTYSSSDGIIKFDAGLGNTWSLVFNDFDYSNTSGEVNLLGQLSMRQSNDNITYENVSSVPWFIDTKNQYNLNDAYGSSATRWGTPGNVAGTNNITNARIFYNAGNPTIAEINARYIEFTYDNDVSNRGHANTNANRGWDISIQVIKDGNDFVNTIDCEISAPIAINTPLYAGERNNSTYNWNVVNDNSGDGQFKLIGYAAATDASDNSVFIKCDRIPLDKVSTTQTSLRGYQGYLGPQGNAGLLGATGPMHVGITGPKGNQGHINGGEGPQGPQGNKGVVGESSKIIEWLSILQLTDYNDNTPDTFGIIPFGSDPREEGSELIDPLYLKINKSTHSSEYFIPIQLSNRSEPPVDYRSLYMLCDPTNINTNSLQDLRDYTSEMGIDRATAAINIIQPGKYKITINASVTKSANSYRQRAIQLHRLRSSSPKNSGCIAQFRFSGQQKRPWIYNYCFIDNFEKGDILFYIVVPLSSSYKGPNNWTSHRINGFGSYDTSLCYGSYFKIQYLNDNVNTGWSPWSLK
jgi:hypothetical protein